MWEVKIEQERDVLIRKLAEILYHQYIRDLKEGKLHTDSNITKIKERVK